MTLLLANTTHAVTLNDLQQMALKNREVVERYKVNLEKGEKGVTLARSGYYPSLDVAYVENRLNRDSVFEEKENSLFSGTVTWNIFAGFRDKYSIKSAKFLRDVESYKLQEIEQDVQLNVALRYVGIFERQASLQVAEDLYSSLLRAYKDTENRYDVGLINKNELLKIKVDLDNAEIGQKLAQTEVIKSIRLLQRELDMEIKPEELTFSEFDQLPNLEGPEQYEEKMLEQRGDIKIIEESYQAAEMTAKAERSLYFPRVDISSSYLKYDYELPDATGGSYDDEVRHQLMLSINLFDGFSSTSRIGQARLEARGVHYDLEELKKQLTTELRNLYSDYEVSKSNVTVAETSIDQANENLRIAQLSYKEGLTTSTDLLDAIANLSRAKYNYVAAKRDLFANYYRLTRAVSGF